MFYVHVSFPTCISCTHTSAPSCAGEMFINDVAKAPKQAMQALSAKTDAVGSSEWVRSGCGLVFLPGLAD